MKDYGLSRQEDHEATKEPLIKSEVPVVQGCTTKINNDKLLILKQGANHICAVACSDKSGTDLFRASLEILHSALQNLASTADEQLKYLAALDLHDSVDEIALEFDDIVSAFVVDVEPPEALRNDLRKIDERLGEMSDREDLWTPDALKLRQAWSKIRSISQRAIEGLSVSK